MGFFYVFLWIARNTNGEPFVWQTPFATSLGINPQTPFYSHRTKQKTNYGGTIIKDKKKIKTNRVRPYSYSFRVSETEKMLLDEKVNQSGLSLTEYLIRVLLDKTIVSISCGSEILAELKRQGNNLNQAVKNCYFGYNTEKELLSTNAECKKLYGKLSNAIGGG